MSQHKKIFFARVRRFPRTAFNVQQLPIKTESWNEFHYPFERSEMAGGTQEREFFNHSAGCGDFSAVIQERAKACNDLEKIKKLLKFSISITTKHSNSIGI